VASQPPILAWIRSSSSGSGIQGGGGGGRAGEGRRRRSPPASLVDLHHRVILALRQHEPARAAERDDAVAHGGESASRPLIVFGDS